MEINSAPCTTPSPRYGGPIPAPLGHPLPSKAELILSRYRPIAPKPASFPSVPIQDSDHALSSVTNSGVIDTAAGTPANAHICCRQVPELGKSKRARKRKAPASSTLASAPRYAKKGAMTMPPEKAVALSLQERRESAADASSLLESTRMMQQQDAGFMARAAASSPPCVLPERKTNCRVAGLAPTNSRGSAVGGFSEMIRSITGLSTVSDVRSLMHHSKPLEAAMAKPSGELGIVSTLGSPFGAENPAQLQGLSTPCSTREELICGEINKLQEDNLADLHATEEDDSCPKLVTLALLPDTALCSDNSTAESSISTCSSLAYGYNMSLNTTSSDDACPGPSSPSSLQPPCDITGIELMYDKSPEPVVLVDDNTGSVIWLNKAYRKALKDALERKSTAPFIDPLGTPTELHKFHLHLDGSSQSPSSGKLSPATLWGFLKKLVVDVEGGEGTPSVLDSTSLFSSCTRNKPLHYTSSPQYNDANKNVVIVPQPKRLIGSTISLESITDMSPQGFAVLDCLDMLKQHLEEGVSPAIITDSNYLVKWVNSSYKQMVGQPECPWLASTMGDSSASYCQQSPRLAGEVLLVRTMDIPSSVFAFSGRANIQWSCRGGRTCMTVPYDVSRLQCTSTGLAVLVWKFDIQASLSLACTAARGEVK